MVTPSVHVRTSLEAIKPYAHKIKPIFYVQRCRTNQWQTFDNCDERGSATIGCNLAVLSGPNHAEEVGRNLPAASVLSTESLEVATTLQKAICGQNFRIYANTDMIGVELADHENIIALAAGIADGLALGDNCKFYY